MGTDARMTGEFADITGQWDYSELPPNVRLGRDVFLELKASFTRFRSKRDPGLVIGDRVRIYNMTVMSVEETGAITIGEDSILVGPTFWCAGDITIGRRVVLSYHVVIADGDFHPRDPTLRRNDAIAIAPGGDARNRPPYVTRPVVIEDDVHIGIGAMILKGVRIGAGSSVAAGAVVTSDVPPMTHVAGNPARIDNLGNEAL